MNKTCKSCERPFITDFASRKYCDTCSLTISQDERDVKEKLRKSRARKTTDKKAFIATRNITNVSTKSLEKAREIFDNFKIQISCQLCNYKKHPTVLEFHHAGQKDGLINPRRIILEGLDIIPELKECCVLCRNCHKEVHLNISKCPPTIGEEKAYFLVNRINTL